MLGKYFLNSFLFSPQNGISNCAGRLTPGSLLDKESVTADSW
uniref:Uncharacterized protein n=1 Tax=Anguilla anguilla TaxID=7936 RepID=A0A0E9R5Q1_ANGAN